MLIQYTVVKGKNNDNKTADEWMLREEGEWGRGRGGGGGEARCLGRDCTARGWDSLLVENRTRDRKVGVRVPAEAVGEFSSPELTFCADSYSVSVPPRVTTGARRLKDPGHSAKSAGGR